MRYLGYSAHDNDIIRRQHLSDSTIIRREQVLSAYEQRAIAELQRTNRLLYSHYPSHGLAHQRITREYERIRELRRLLEKSRKASEVKKAVVAAIDTFLEKLRKKVSYLYHLIQILREQKRLQQKIKSLYKPIKIIPESLRPIELAA